MINELKELLDIDRKFCAESQTNGYKAWETYLSEDVLFGGNPEEPYTTGKQNIIPTMMHFYQLEDLHFTWDPKYGFLSDDNTLGVTTGTYERTYLFNNEVVTKKGKYTTTWKKINNEWKIVFDIGN